MVALLAGPNQSRADPQEIEEGEPVTLEDAFTDPAGQFSLQYSGNFTARHDRGAHDQLEQGPTFKLGAIKYVQVSINPNYDSGPTSQRNSGFVLGDTLVQLNDQTAILPAFAVDVFYALPFGAGHKTPQYTFRALASKSIGTGDDAPRLHLNLTDYHTTQPDQGDRTDQLQLVAGGSFLLTEKDAIVTDIVHGAAEQQDHTETLLEIGYSRDLPQDWTLQLGVGKQVAGHANAARVFFAIEKELQIF